MFLTPVLFTFCMEQPWGKPLKKRSFLLPWGHTQLYLPGAHWKCAGASKVISLSLWEGTLQPRDPWTLKLFSHVNPKFLFA